MRLRLQILGLNFGKNLAGARSIFSSGKSLIKQRARWPFQRAKRRWSRPLPKQAAGAPAGCAGMSTSLFAKLGAAKLASLWLHADYLITDICGGFGALWMGMPCANANVTARSTTWGPWWLVLFYCFSSIIMFNSCVVSSKCLSLRAWPHLLK